MALRHVLHQLRTAGRVARRQQEVHVVRHQAVRMHRAAKLGRVFAYCREVRSVIGFVEEAIPPS
jgi:hypothetical protein